MNTSLEMGASEERPDSLGVSAGKYNHTKSLERASSPTTITHQENILQNVMIAHHDQLLGESSVLDEHNPRSWSVRRKCIIAFFALLSAFVA
jgi:hypothetical protein